MALLGNTNILTTIMTDSESIHTFESLSISYYQTYSLFQFTKPF